MNTLLDIFDSRKLLLDELLKWQEIPIGLPKLIIILEILRNLQSSSIINCLKTEPKQWEMIVQSLQNKEDEPTQVLSDSKIEEVYQSYTQGKVGAVALNDM